MSVVPTPETAPTANPAPPSDSRLAAMQEKVTEWIGDHPTLVLGAGLIVGAAIGWLVKRKK